MKSASITEDEVSDNETEPTYKKPIHDEFCKHNPR